MSASGIRAGRAFIELWMDNKLFDRNIKQAADRLKSFGSSVKDIGMQAGVSGAVLAAPLAASAIVFKDFEYAMQRVKALSGATGKDFEMLKDEAKRLGRETEWQARQAGEAMQFFALAGFNAKEIYQTIGPTLDVATAGKIDAAAAADVLVGALRGMGLETEKSTHVADVMAKAMTRANINMLEAGDTLKYAAPVARQAGVAFEELMGATMLLGDAGIKGSMAGTGLRGMLLTLSNPAAEGAALLKELNVQILDGEGNFRKMADIVDDFNAGMEGLGGGEKLAKIGKLMDTRQAASFAVLLHKGGDALRDRQHMLKNAAGTARAIANVQLDSIQGAWLILKSTVEGVAITIGEMLMPAIRAGIQWINDTTLAVEAWVKQNKEAVFLLGGIAAGLLSVGGILIAVGFGIGAAGTAISGFLTVLGGLVSPIGLILTAITAIGAAIVYATASGDTFGEKMQSIWQAIGDGAKAAFDFILRAVAFVIVAFQNWQQFIDAIPDGLFALAAVGGGHILWLWDNIKIFASWFGTHFVEIFKNVAKNIGIIFGTIAGEFSNLWNAIDAKMKNPLSNFTWKPSEALNRLGGMSLTPLASEGPQFKERVFNAGETELWNRAGKGFAPFNDAANQMAGEWKDQLMGMFGDSKSAPGDAARKGGGPLADPEGVPPPPGVVAGKTFGTFSAAAAMAQAGSSPQERTNKILEQMKKKMDEELRAMFRMEQLLRDRGLAFD